MNTFNKLAMLCIALTLSISSCKKAKDDLLDGLGTGPNTMVYGLSSDNKLLTFTADNPSAANTVAITGLQTGETIVGIDFRPATGQLYGISSAGRLYVLNTQTGAALQIGTTAFTPALNNSIVGFDFNPTVDRIRLVSTSGQNLRLHPETGAVAATDGVTNGPISSGVSAAAYTNNKAGAATTELYVLDAATDKLYKQDPPNNGTLVAVGSGLGYDAEQIGGFDIGPTGLALATIKVSGKTSLYAIDIATGKALRLRNDFAGDVIGLAIPTEPVAFAISSANELVIFNPLSPSPVSKPISGLATGETVLGIDFRPATGQLFALGSTSRLYVLNTSSGAATAVSVAPFATLLSGTDFGFDFNPTVDRVRIVSNTGQNLRVNPNDGTIAVVDGNLSGTAPSVTAAAYSNNFAGATTTVLYDIDTQAGKLVKQDPPNAGTLVDVGPLGVTASAANGFDIGSKSGIAYALLTVSGTTKIYTINLTTGAATAGATLSGTYKAFSLGLGF